MKIYIFGLGAIGSNLLTNLVMDTKDVEFIIIDKDKVEARNIQAGTQFYFRDQISNSKVKALKMNIYNLFGKKIHSQFEVNVDEKNINNILLPESADLVIDTFDNAVSRNMLRKFCKKFNMNCVHIGFSPQYTFEVTWNEDYQEQDGANQGIDICEMIGARAFVQAVSGLASQVILQFIRDKKKINIAGNKFISKIVS